MKQQLEKLEANSKKAGKKGGESLKEVTKMVCRQNLTTILFFYQAITALNDKVKEVDQIKSDKLRTILLLERRKYCNFLSYWNPVIQMMIQEHDQVLRKMLLIDGMFEISLYLNREIN
jgi:hypothetical protein